MRTKAAIFDAEITSLYEAGISQRDVQSLTGLSRASVQRRLRVLGLKRRHDLVAKDSEISRRYLAGESSILIAGDLGTCHQAVLYRLGKMGIEIRETREYLTGSPKSEAHKKALSQSRIESGCAKGDKNPNWKGGMQSDWEKLKNSANYKQWRKSVYERDGYACRGCGDDSGGNLHAHHILPKRDFPALTFSVSNGITLCESCHEKTMNREYESANHWEALMKSPSTTVGNPTSAMRFEGIRTGVSLRED